jgi:hypothetical protein
VQCGTSLAAYVRLAVMAACAATAVRASPYTDIQDSRVLTWHKVKHAIKVMRLPAPDGRLTARSTAAAFGIASPQPDMLALVVLCDKLNASNLLHPR